MLTDKRLLFVFWQGNASPFTWSCLHHNRFWGGGEARRRMGTYSSSSSSAKLTMRPEWTEAGRQYRSAGTLRSSQYPISSFPPFPQTSLQSGISSVYGRFYWLIETKLTPRRGQVVWSPNSAMTSPAKFRKDKEIVAEYETQVKGKKKNNFSKASHVTRCSSRWSSVPLNVCFLTVKRVFFVFFLLVLADCMGFSVPSPLLSGVKRTTRSPFVFRRSFMKVNCRHADVADRSCIDNRSH